MIIRLTKVLLIAATAFFYSVVVFNNITDYNSNYQFVRHVLMMDSTFPGNNGMWRAIQNPAIHQLFYIGIICWEALTALLLWFGAFATARDLRSPAAIFNLSKRFAIGALTLGMLMWLVAFLTVGAEWFLMWQSKTWNGQEAAFRMFAVVGIVLLLVNMTDSDQQC
jgi:predicted small integral membrane protein